MAAIPVTLTRSGGAVHSVGNSVGDSPRTTTGVRGVPGDPLVDRFGRVHRDLRISLTDRCSLRCTYCMPEQGNEWLARSGLMPADEIVAQPTTLTGSIGVLAGKFVTTEIKEKLGLVLSDVTAGAWASFMSANSRFTDEQWAALNRSLHEISADFTGKAATDRHLAIEVLEPLARGRVWIGVDARERGLIDHLGGMGLAIDRALAAGDAGQLLLWIGVKLIAPDDDDHGNVQSSDKLLAAIQTIIVAD